MRLARTAVLGVLAGVGSLGLAARTATVDTDAAILGSWPVPITDPANRLIDFAGWNDSLIVSIGTGGADPIWMRALEVDVADPASAAITRDDTVSMITPDREELHYLWRRMVQREDIVSVGTLDYFVTDPGTPFETISEDSTFEVRRMPGAPGGFIHVGNDDQFTWFDDPFYAVSRGNTLQLYDDSTGDEVFHPDFLGRFSLRRLAITEVDGTRLYATQLLSSSNDVSVYDIADIANPVLLTDEFPEIGASDLLRDGLLFRRVSSDGVGSIEILDTRPATLPVSLSTMVIDDSPEVFVRKMYRDGDLFYVARSDGVLVFDVAVPSDPRLIAVYDGLGDVRFLGFGEGRFYAAAVTLDGTAILTLAAVPGARCSRSDLAEPFGVLDLGDVQAFVVGFVAGDAIVDAELPLGVLDLADLQAFVGAFNAGCP